MFCTDRSIKLARREQKVQKHIISCYMEFIDRTIPIGRNFCR